MTVKVIDLFCGIGGLTNGLQQAGLEVVAGIDLDDKCKYAFEKNNGSKFIYKSVSDVTGEELLELFGNDKIKILVGCAPCQPFSNHQKDKKNKKNHKDWGLLYDFLRLVKETKPTIVSMENVPSLVKEKVFIDFVQGLEDLGYAVTYKVENTYNFGMAQRRNRLLLLASTLGKIVFAEDEEKGKSVREVIGHLPKIEAGIADSKDRYHISSKLSEINLKRIINSTPGGSWKDWSSDLLPECYKKSSGQSYTSVYGRMKFDSVSPTLTTQFNAYGTGRFGHPEQNRAISIREGALLQSFPENYVFVPENEEIHISILSKQIGNAVPPRLGLHIGKSITKHLEEYKYGEK